MVKIWTILGVVFLCGLVVSSQYAKEKYVINSFIDVENGLFFKSIFEHKNNEESEEDAHTFKFSTDLILTTEQEQDFEPLDTEDVTGQTEKRKVVPHKNSLWPNGIVPYKFSTKRRFTGQRAPMAVRQAMRHWEKYTCIKFVETNSPAYHRPEVTKKGYVEIGTGSGCASMVSFLGRGRQSMFLNEQSCLKLGTIAHELGHVIGFYHEHARSDRDDYVRIIKKHIRRGYLSNFLKARKTLNAAPYDLASDMHYGPMFFSDRGYDTIVAKDPFLQFLMGRRYGLSFYDIQEANSAYKCAESCKGLPKCENGGYLLKDCTCHCPDGLAGHTCEQISRTQSKGNGYVYFLTYGSGKQITSQYPHTHAIWLVKSPENTTLELELVLDLSRDEKTHTCRHWVEIRYNLIGQEGPRFCGLSIEIYPLIETVSNILMIKFNAEIGQSVRNTNHEMVININVLGRIDRHVQCTFKDVDMDYCPFFHLNSAKVDFKRIVIPLSWIKEHPQIIEEKHREYLYLDTTNNMANTASCISAQLQAGTWCIKFSYWIYANTTSSSLQLKAILINNSDAHATHTHPERRVITRPTYRGNVNPEFDSEHSVLSSSHAKTESEERREDKNTEDKVNVLNSKSSNLDLLSQLLDVKESSVDHQQPLPGFEDHLTSKLFEPLQTIGQRKYHKQNIRRGIVQGTKKYIKKPVNIQHKIKHIQDYSRPLPGFEDHVTSELFQPLPNIGEKQDTKENIRRGFFQRTKKNLKDSISVRHNKRHFKNVYVRHVDATTERKTVRSSDEDEYVFDDSGADEQWLWQTSEPTMSWKDVKITFRSARIFQVQFDGIVSSGDTIMIDEFELSPGDYPVVVDFFCDFETDACGFVNDPRVHSMSWVRKQKLDIFGPKSDHTFGQPSHGWFLTRDKLVNKPGAVGITVSKTFDLDRQAGCVEFWFYAWGFSFGTLSLYQHYSDDSEYELVWTLTISWLHKGQWKKERHPVKTDKPFELVFFTEVGHPWGAFAIDDISLTTGPC